jgi:hypothetical protein
MSINLGVNVLEVDGRVSPSIQPAPTSVAGFIIRAQRGVQGEVVRVTNWGQFQERFGSFMQGNVYGAYAVRGFFDNGGSIAYVTRVINTEGARVARIESAVQSEWSPLPDGATLALATRSGDVSREIAIPFAAGREPAELTGNAEFSLEAEEPLDITVIVNGGDEQPYAFSEDFLEGLATATPAQVAAVLNRELEGVQVYVSEEGNLQMRTDLDGRGASLEVTGSAARVLFGDTLRALGSGNLENLSAVRPEEVAAAIRAEIEWAGIDWLRVSERASRVVIEQTNPGGTIEVVSDTSVPQDIFGFTQVQGGEEGAGEAAIAASRQFGDLTVTAGYRGSPDEGDWGNHLAIEIQSAEAEAEDGSFNLIVHRDRPRGEGMDEIERWDGLSMADAEDQINHSDSGSRYIRVSVSSTTPPAPDACQPTHLDGGLDGGFESDEDNGTAYATAVDLFRLHEIQLLCCPESTDKGLINAALKEKG